MNEKLRFFKSILYICLQVASLWGIFALLTDTISQSNAKIVGVFILTLIFFIYAHKNIKILNYYSEKSEAHDKAGLAV